MNQIKEEMTEDSLKTDSSIQNGVIQHEICGLDSEKGIEKELEKEIE